MLGYINHIILTSFYYSTIAIIRGVFIFLNVASNHRYIKVLYVFISGSPKRYILDKTDKGVTNVLLMS